MNDSFNVLLSISAYNSATHEQRAENRPLFKDRITTEAEGLTQAGAEKKRVRDDAAKHRSTLEQDREKPAQPEDKPAQDAEKLGNPWQNMTKTPQNPHNSAQNLRKTAQNLHNPAQSLTKTAQNLRKTPQ